ncbi:transposable element Tc1 transposase [Trichonephila clavipes]|nr:transposable element Tc1 transposase [Trichonephila clavipes]
MFGMSSRHHIDDFMRVRIIGKIEEGRKITDVAREFDIAHNVVSRLWKSFKTTGMSSRRHGGDHVRSTTPAEDTYIVLSAKRNRRTTAQQVANQFLAASGKQISRKTVVRRLRGGGLYARRLVVCDPLTRQHRTARLQWCREHHNWTEQDWACVLFSDESRFSLSSDCRRQLIWRESGTAYRPENMQEKDRYPTCCIMTWAGIMINGRTRLHVVANGTMTGQRYIDEVLLPYVRLFRGADGGKLFLYLNPIENVWDALGRQVAGRNYPPTNKNTLIRALTEEWDKLPQQLLDNVVQSMTILRLRIPLRRNRRQYEQLTDFDRGRIIGLREAGWSNRRIGRHLGRSDMVVARCWQQWITEGRVYRRGESGRPWNTNDREDRAIRRVATSAPTTSLASIQRHLPPSRHPVPSRETIRRRLTEVGLRSRRPLRRLPLTPHHRQCRLDFCRPRATWSVTDWRRVIFSDESRFSLSADDHRTCLEAHRPAVRSGIYCRAAYSNFTRYVDDILTPIVLPMLSSRPGAIYQQDNARPHTARLSQQCLQGYDFLPWPARSPDLSPIEHVWTRWGKATAAVPRYRRINCADAKTMARSSTGVISDLIESMPRRISACIAARGGFATY